MAFSIKLTKYDVWLGKRNLSYFITDDSYLTLAPENTIKLVLKMGVSEKQRRLFSSTDEIRRSLRCCNKETIVKTIPHSSSMFNLEILARGNSLGKFSNFVVVDLTNDITYSLDDVISGLV